MYMCAEGLQKKKNKNRRGSAPISVVDILRRLLTILKILLLSSDDAPKPSARFAADMLYTYNIYYYHTTRCTSTDCCRKVNYFSYTRV